MTLTLTELGLQAGGAGSAAYTAVAESGVLLVDFGVATAAGGYIVPSLADTLATPYAMILSAQAKNTAFPYGTMRLWAARAAAALSGTRVSLTAPGATCSLVGGGCAGASPEAYGAASVNNHTSNSLAGITLTTSAPVKRGDLVVAAAYADWYPASWLIPAGWALCGQSSTVPSVAMFATCPGADGVVSVTIANQGNYTTAGLVAAFRAGGANPYGMLL